MLQNVRNSARHARAFEAPNPPLSLGSYSAMTFEARSIHPMRANLSSNGACSICVIYERIDPCRTDFFWQAQ
jgi:hypothetical protein